tara:strand:- start:7668 stop:8834 length:1167 start_codon:yes stop_codon:yes gene_type:complete
MALQPRAHGIKQTESPIGRVSLEVAPTSIWGIIATAPSAVTASDLEQDKAILITDLDAAILLAGADGTAGRALRAIADFGRSIGVLVIVAQGEGEDAPEIAADQTAKVIAGLELLRSAEQAIGVKPRILAAPGLDALDVLTAMSVVAQRVDGFAYGASVGATPVEIETYRTGLAARELMLIDGDFLAFDAVAEEESVSWATARAVGLRAQLDRDVGYHKTISNVVIPGVTGVTVPRSWDLHSVDTEMGLINGADVTGIIRRGGMRFWGNRTCSADPRFVFESAVRTNQALRDTIGEGLFPYIDQPLRPSLAIDIIESINALGRREVRAGRLIGFEAFLAEGNTADQLAAGKLRIGYRFTACAPLEDLNVNSEITDEFYADFAQLVTGA